MEAAAPPRLAARVATGIAVAAVVVATLVLIPDPLQARAALIAGVCLVLWLTEAIPLYATTIVLWAGVALLLGPADPKTFSLGRVLTWAAQPVMALFFGGFALSVAGAKYGVDSTIAAWMLRASRGRRAVLLLSVMAGTAVLSMWMSNIAAGAMMVATLRPLFAGAAAGTSDPDVAFRKALLLGIAFAADFGGIGTPIGTGPNLIAVGAVAHAYRITFLHWTLFGVPLALAMVLLAYGLLMGLYRVRGAVGRLEVPHAPLSRRGRAVVAIFFAGTATWLTEPMHGVPSAVTALLIAAALFGSGLLGTADLSKMEWDTLLLIAGGLTLGELFDESGLAASMAAAVPWRTIHPTLLVLCFVVACALLSAVASNTAAAAILVQIGLGIVPAPSFAVLVALGASMGVPFVISTPPNAIVYGEGVLRTRDFALPGMVLMVVGCLILALTGPTVLKWVGVP
jgi:sodium-dependent dicarboxylate transporter 2/3/5